MMPGRCHPAARRGFTLIESLATVLILGILGSIASFLILDAVDGYTVASTSAQLHAEISISMDRATRELRRIELDGGAAGVAPNVDSTAADWIIWQDSDGDQYQIGRSGSDLVIETDGSGTAVLMSDVTVFTITTFDEDNAQLGFVLSGVGCDPIRRVQIEFETQRSGVTEKMRTKVFIRSTMDGAQ